MTATTQATRSRRRPPPLQATVSNRTQLSPHLVRVTITGPALAGFHYPGPASHFKLILPAAGTGELTLPTPGDDGLVTLDTAPLIMRTYTARAFRPEVNEVDIDVFLHGDGPASTWAATAQPGNEIAVTSPRRSEFHVPESAGWILLAVDGSAIPALATILEVESRIPIRCVVELDDARDRVELPDRASASVHLERGDHRHSAGCCSATTPGSSPGRCCSSARTSTASPRLEKELLTSILLIGAVAGALAGGADRRPGRPAPTVLGTAAVFVAGVLLAAFSPGYVVLLAARVVIGLAVGSASMVVPLYIGEVVPPGIRGALVSFNQLAITSGILVSYLVDYGLSVQRELAADVRLAAIPAIAMFVGMLFQRESPHWLIGRAARTRPGRARAGPGPGRHRRRDRRGAEVPARASTARDLLNPSPPAWSHVGRRCWPCSSRSPASTRSSTTRRRCCPGPGSATPPRCWPTSSTAPSTSA
jgi:NADPH-dependent ferric siderophore reductase